MARFLLSAMPFTGHVAPFLGVARALVERGHDVRVHTGSRFRERVTAGGAALVPWRAAPDFDEYDMPATFPRLVGEPGMRQLIVNIVDCFVRTAPAQIDDLRAEWEREPWDALAADETSIGAVLFSELRGTPWTTVGVLPLNLIGPDGPPSGMGLAPGTTPITRARDAALRAIVPLMARPISVAIGDAAQEVGLPRGRRRMDRIVFSPTLVLASGGRMLEYGRTDRPPHVRDVGVLAGAAPAGRPSSALPAWWPELADRPVVLVSQGTQNIDPDDLVRPTIEGLADLDALVVATPGVPGRDVLPFPVPPNVRVAGFVPFDGLLPHVEVMVTNGGWGGTLAALRHDVPLVVAGADLDKPEVASRVAHAGAGLDLRTGAPSARAVAAAVRRVRTEPSFREAAARVGGELRSLGGAPRAATYLEAALPAAH